MELGARQVAGSRTSHSRGWKTSRIQILRGRGCYSPSSSRRSDVRKKGRRDRSALPSIISLLPAFSPTRAKRRSTCTRPWGLLLPPASTAAWQKGHHDYPRATVAHRPGGSGARRGGARGRRRRGSHRGTGVEEALKSARRPRRRAPPAPPADRRAPRVHAEHVDLASPARVETATASAKPSSCRMHPLAMLMKHAQPSSSPSTNTPSPTALLGRWCRDGFDDRQEVDQPAPLPRTPR
jgi:hypothetical protein